MKRVAALVVVVAIGLAAEAQATPVVFWTPSAPTSGDSVSVVVGNSFTDRCPVADPANCVRTAPETLDVTVNVVYCHNDPDCGCAQVESGYRQTCPFGRLPAGTYVARFTEVHEGPYDPLHTFTKTVTFTVSGATPVPSHTWGSLKSRYR